MAALRTTLRHNICYFQTIRQKVLSLLECPRKAKKEANLAAVRIRRHDRVGTGSRPAYRRA
jgi:hypothetical protein